MSAAPDYLGSLDPNDPQTPSQQIANRLHAAILTGQLKPETKLPSQPFLAAHYGVARETVKSALRNLQAAGLIVSRKGSGSYVREKADIAFTQSSPELEAIALLRNDLVKLQERITAIETQLEQR
jgi:DNA-binding GntR family transcriptional regulator